MSLEVYVADISGSTVKISLVGRLDSNTSVIFERHVDEVLAGPVRDLVVDLEHLKYISSAGIGELFRTRQQLLARGGRVAVINPQPGVRKVFEILQSVRDLSVFSSQEELDNYLDAMQRRHQSRSR